MLAFCAYYEGIPKCSEAEFDTYIMEIHMPLVAKYPNLQQLRFLKAQPRIGEAPDFYLSFELFFNNWEEFEVAKNSSERALAVEDALKLAAMFEGTIHHVVYEKHEISI